MIDWSDFQHLLALSQYNSLSQAAEALDVTRTTVSRRIANLEEQLGAKLVQRVGRDLALTQSGQEVLATVEKIDGDVRGLTRSVFGRDEQLAGLIRLTSTSGMAHLLAPDLVNFGQLHPEVRIEVSVTNTREDLEMMEADVALRLTTEPPEGLIGHLLAKPCSALYASQRTADQLNSKSPMELITYPSVKEVPSWLAEDAGIEAYLGFKANSVEVISPVVLAGNGIAELPCYVGETTPGLIQINPPRSGQFLPDLWLLYHPRLRPVHRVQAFVQHLMQVFVRLRPLIEGCSTKSL